MERGHHANMIIKNYRSLREELYAEGVVFRSDTNTEVSPILVGRLVCMGDMR
jgi:glucosamine--fructose-6-phosphate aminotransferase (isomerizing)